MSLTFRRLSLGSASLAVLVLALTGCDDPTCVFVNGCRDGASSGSGGSLGPGAVAPRTGEWISNQPPEIEEIFPQGGGVDPQTPVVLTFSESMNPESLIGRFEVVPFSGVGFLNPVPLASESLVGDGRVWVMIPAQPLDLFGYFVRVVGTPVSTSDPDPFGGGAGDPFGGGTGEPGVVNPSPPTDLTGQVLELMPGTFIGEVFTVAEAAAEPALVMSWPIDGTETGGDRTEIVAVFGRPMDPTTFDNESFQVEENGGDPDFDPDPVPLFAAGAEETRVWSWRSLDTNGNPERFAADAGIALDLSRSGNALSDDLGNTMAPTQAGFQVTPFSSPLSVNILSQPHDAIGIRNLTEDGSEDLAVQVDLNEIEDDDVLELYLTGTSTSDETQLVTLRREMSLSDGQTVSNWDLNDIDLGSAIDPRFAEGPVAFAYRVRRAAVNGPLTVLDVEPGVSGPQDPVLDVTIPTILSLDLAEPGLRESASDVRDLVLAGNADDLLRSVEVSATVGAVMLDNGILPAVVGASGAGDFLAAPVAFGVFSDSTASFTAVGYDTAFNPSVPVSGTFDQLGAVGPGAFSPGDTLTVEVFDAESLLPLGGALVLVNADLGDGVSYPLTASGTTASDGTFTASTNGAAVGSIVTIDLLGYDLFTFHGVTSTRVSIPLAAVDFGANADVEGEVLSSDEMTDAILPGLARRIDDSRRPADVVHGYATDACTPQPRFSCAYGPEPILTGRHGVQAFYAGDFMTSEATFDAAAVLQAFCLETPLARIASGQTDDTTFQLPFLLTDPTIDPSELPFELPALVLDAATTSGIDLGDLDNDPETTGDPFVTVETLVPGVPGTVAVGQGFGFDQGGDVWNVRSAAPGAVTPGGFFGLSGTVDTDLLVRLELRDSAGNVSGGRPRLSDVPGLPGSVVFAPDVPVLTTPAPGGSTLGRSYDLVFPDTLPDATGNAGLHAARLVDQNDRGWVLWRSDSTGGAPVRLHVVDTAAEGGAGLADGPIECVLAAYAWTSLSPSEFLWTDVEREQDSFAVSEAFAFTQTP